MVKRIKIKPIGLALLAVVILTACGQKRALIIHGLKKNRHFFLFFFIFQNVLKLSRWT